MSQWLSDPAAQAGARRSQSARTSANSRQWLRFSAPLMPATSQGWERLNEDLACYGHRVLSAWIANGVIFARVRSITPISLTGAPELLHDPDAASELAGLTVAVALPAFRARLEEGTGWRPEQGAALASFFIGQCLLRFPNEYRRWLREYRAGSCSLPLSEARELPDPCPGPGQLATWRLEACEVLTQAPARTRTVLAQVALGYPHRDIAEQLHTTPKAVEMILRRHRRRLVPSSPLRKPPR